MEPAHYKEEGNRLFQQGLWSQAIEQYTEGLRRGDSTLPPDVRGLLLSNRSQCWLNLEEWQRALSDADACLQLLPEHVKSLYRRAQALEKTGKPSEALSDYVKVAKADPKHRVAVEAAKRLREELLRSGEQKRDEILPKHLLDVLRKPADVSAGQTPDEAIDACIKLRGLCVHKGCTSSLLQAGAVELLVEKCTAAETHQELREEALAALFSMAAGQEKCDEDDAVSRQPAPTSEPLPTAPGVAEVRKRLCSAFRLAELRALCRGSARATRYLALIVGFAHEPEDADALEVIHDALAFVEGEADTVSRAGITALTTMLDTRRRLGKLGRAVRPTAALLKCLESALGTSGTGPLQSLMATAFTLLADTDRPKGDEVDLPAVGLKILEPFLQSEEARLMSNGLSGFCALLAVNVQAGTQLLRQSPGPLLAIMRALKQPSSEPAGRDAQDHAAECMLLATGDQKTRQQLIDSGGIDTLLNALADGEEGSKGLMRAKIVAVLAIIAGHNKEVREEVFDRLDFLLELRDALDKARESVTSARAGGAGAPRLDQARRLCLGLYESCACLTIHGEFKESLLASKKTLKAMQDLMKPEELAEDSQLAVLYTSIIYNLCRSREDKVRPKKNEFPFNELEEDDLNAIEEFYERMPAEARPVKNGEVDAGSKELAAQLRAWCVLQNGDGQAQRPPADRAGAVGSGAVARLARCALGSSARARQMAALSLHFLCAEKEHRRFVASSGGVRALLGLVDLEEETGRNAARQALAQILIVTNPSLLQYSEQLDAVRPLVEMLEHRHELLQFEGAMALTNLLTVSEELRFRAIKADAWRACRDLLFIENELVQRAGLEAMCNLTMAPEILERFATGKAELEIKIFIGFCHADDHATCIASSGALAMLAGSDEVAVQIAASENFADLLGALAAAEDPGVQHRLTAAVCGVCEAEDCPPDVVRRARSALKERKGKGFVSREADALARSVLEEGAISAGGA